VTLILARGVYFAAAMLLFGGAVFRTLLKTNLKLDVPARLHQSILAVALVAGCT